METLRPAGHNEKRCIIREHLSLYNNIVTTGTYSNIANLSNDDYIKTVKQCVLEHPVLSTGVRDAHTEKPMLVRHTPIDVSKHMQVSTPGSTNTDLVQILEMIHNERPNEDKDESQWKVYILHFTAKKSYVAFSYSHALTDGVSGYTFHSSFVKALKNITTSPLDANPFLHIAEPKQILPPVEQAGNLSISWSFLLGPLVNEYFPKPIAKLLGLHKNTPADVWLGAATRSPRDEAQRLRTAVHLFSLPPSDMQNILTTCRANSTRLTGLLHILVSKSLSLALRNRNQSYNTFIGDTAINLRPALGGKGTGQMAAYVSTTAEIITVDPRHVPSHQPDWETSARITANLESRAATLADQPIGLLYYLSNYREWLLNNAAKPPHSSYEISNLGVFVDEEDARGDSTDALRIEEMLFSQSANGVGPPLNVNVASTKGGSLTVSLTWWTGMLGVEDERGFVEEVGEGIVRELKALAA